MDRPAPVITRLPASRAASPSRASRPSLVRTSVATRTPTGRSTRA